MANKKKSGKKSVTTGFYNGSFPLPGAIFLRNLKKKKKTKSFNPTTPIRRLKIVIKKSQVFGVGEIASCPKAQPQKQRFDTFRSSTADYFKFNNI